MVLTKREKIKFISGDSNVRQYKKLLKCEAVRNTKQTKLHLLKTDDKFAESAFIDAVKEINTLAEREQRLLNLVTHVNQNKFQPVEIPAEQPEKHVAKVIKNKQHKNRRQLNDNISKSLKDF